MLPAGEAPWRWHHASPSLRHVGRPSPGCGRGRCKRPSGDQIEQPTGGWAAPGSSPLRPWPAHRPSLAGRSVGVQSVGKVRGGRMVSQDGRCVGACQPSAVASLTGARRLLARVSQSQLRAGMVFGAEGHDHGRSSSSCVRMRHALACQPGPRPPSVTCSRATAWSLPGPFGGHCGGRRFLVNQRTFLGRGAGRGVHAGVLAWCWGLGLWGAVAALDEHEARHGKRPSSESVAVVRLVARLEGDACRRLAPASGTKVARNGLDALVRAWRRLSASPWASPGGGRLG